MDVDIGEINEVDVTLAYNFLTPGEILKEGGDFFEGYNRNSPKRMIAPDYTFSKISNILKPDNLLSQFIDVMVFDCLIFNQDRHQDNWGICEKGDTKRFAPAYDNSTSLAWNLNDSKIEKIQSDYRSLEAFIERSKSLIGRDKEKHCSHFELIRYIYEKEPLLTSQSILKIKNLTKEDMQNIITPDDLLSETKRRFLADILVWRKEKLLSIL
ncbi:MAG: HipA domain-containing protein [Syntrophomonadaceae bacterium]|jgi:hypothetical protein